jgi:hypothetical protein
MPLTRACYRCGRELEPRAPVGRRDACLGCGGDLHCCRNCGFYDPAYHNQCRETQAERQVDKERGNFCEFFSFAAAAGARPGAPSDARSALDRLFGKGGDS